MSMIDFGHLDVGLRGRGIARGVVVHQSTTPRISLNFPTPIRFPRLTGVSIRDRVLMFNHDEPWRARRVVGSGKSMQTLNLSNLIATCKKLLHFANCAYLKLGCAAGRHYIASMANGVEHDEPPWMEQ
jgi:hypothetical protein